MTIVLFVSTRKIYIKVYQGTSIDNNNKSATIVIKYAKYIILFLFINIIVL